MIEDAYTLGEQLGLEVWCEDEAGPFQTVPQAGPSWQPEGEPAEQPHEYFRHGTAKMLTLLHPRTGATRVQGVTSCTNQVLHGWLQEELSALVAALPATPSALALSAPSKLALSAPSAPALSLPPATTPAALPATTPAALPATTPAALPATTPALPPATTPAALPSTTTRPIWERWLQGLSKPVSLPAELPPLRMLLVLDNWAGHKTAVFVAWRLSQGVEEIIGWLEAVAAHWNQDPTPFVWGGKRRRRRERQRERRHRQGGSGAYTRKPVRRRQPPNYGYAHGK